MNPSDIKKGDIIKLKIEAAGSGGEGIARMDGFVFFVNGAAPGDEAEVKIETVKKAYASGRISKLLSPSPFRTSPACPYYEKCGGCQLQHISYQKQLEIKSSNIRDAIARIGGIREFTFEGIVPSSPFGYRNKVQFVCINGKCGLYERNSHNLISIEGCMLQKEPANKILSAFMEIIGNGKFEYQAMRHIGIRVSSSGDASVTLVMSKRKAKGLKDAAEELMRKITEVKGVSLNINSKNTNVILGDVTIPICGEPFVTEEIMGRKFRINPESFFQVNRDGAEEMVRTVMGFLPEKSDSVFLDAYCGSGFFSMFASGIFRKTIGIEEYEKSIDDAKAAAKLNGIENAEFICGKAEQLITSEALTDVEYALVDPPRKGIEESVINAFASSKIRTVIYVSCNPATLARDLGIFMAKGFEIKSVKGIDMFPQTSHVETVVLMSRVSK